MPESQRLTAAFVSFHKCCPSCRQRWWLLHAGTLYGFGYNLSKPELHYFAISSGGMVKEDFKVTLQQPTMQHDFAMTEDYVIFLDFPLVSNPEVPSRAS